MARMTQVTARNETLLLELRGWAGHVHADWLETLDKIVDATNHRGLRDLAVHVRAARDLARLIPPDANRDVFFPEDESHD